MIEDGRGDAELPVHQAPNSEEIRYHRVDGRRFPEGPGHGRGVVTSSERGAPSRTGANEWGIGLLQDQGGQFKVGIGNAPLRIIKADKVCLDILWPG